MTIPFTEKELAVIRRLAAEKDLPPERVVVMALRTYQMIDELIKRGREFDFSLDDTPTGCGLVE